MTGVATRSWDLLRVVRSLALTWTGGRRSCVLMLMAKRDGHSVCHDGPLEGRDKLISTGPSDNGRYFFPRMASFAALTTLNLTTRFAGIFISLPV